MRLHPCAADPVLKETDKATGLQSFMWVIGSHVAEQKAVCFFYNPSRSGKAARALLEGYQGFLHTDVYKGYDNLPAAIRRVGCLAHARRKFHGATKAGAAGAEGSIAAQALTKIQKIITRFLEDGRLEVDTKWIERQIKPSVIGIKAWLFADTPNGAEASAMLYSMIETCNLNNVVPFSWLKKAFTDLPYAQSLADYEHLLPWNFKKH